jgi:hypothetical protein
MMPMPVIANHAEPAGGFDMAAFCAAYPELRAKVVGSTVYIYGLYFHASLQASVTTWFSQQ